jgi:hypothetical protein
MAFPNWSLGTRKNEKKEWEKMKILSIKNILIYFLLLSSISLLWASTPKIVSYRTQKDFEKGKPRGVSISSSGEVMLAPASALLLNPELPFIWAGVVDAQGNVYVAGGGNTGVIFKIDAEGRSSRFFPQSESASDEAEKLQFYALAVNKQNQLFAAASPQGQVYAFPKNGALNLNDTGFFDPEEVYIWDLAFDGQNNLYVATGEKGKIYKVDAAGRGALFYESEDTHIRRIVFDAAGNLIVGTSNKGIILKLDAQGRAFVLYDSPMVEITDIVIDRAGNIFASAAGEERLQAPPVPGQAPSPTPAGESEEAVASEEDDLDAQVQVIAGAAPPTLGKTGSEVYRIDKDGVVKTIWRARNERIFAMNLDKSENLIVGTGDSGRLYSINAAGEHSLLLALDETQITTLGKDAQGRIFFGASNAGKVYRLSDDFNRKGEYLSDVIDAGVVSQWGALSWEASLKDGAAVAMYSRSGNTEQPDKTWSSWSAKYSAASGEAIASAPARFFQFKAELTTTDGRNTPVLREVSFSYLQKNLPPEILEISILPPGEYYPDAAGNSASESQLSNSAAGQSSQSQYTGRKSFQKGYRSVSWKSRDDNSDNLSFDLFYSSAANPNWQSLVKDFRGSVYSWDSELMPDGEYQIKIVAKDGLSNPPALALNSEKISQPFRVDNSGPRVSEVKVVKIANGAKVTFAVEDELSLVNKVEYGLNVDEWKLVYPVDGICDSKIEKFEIVIDAGQKGRHSLVIKAQDEWGNLGFGKTNIEL